MTEFTKEGYPIMRVRLYKPRSSPNLRAGECYILYGICPYCGKGHSHGGGTDIENINHMLGHRASHCVSPGKNNRGYVLEWMEGENDTND